MILASPYRHYACHQCGSEEFEAVPNTVRMVDARSVVTARCRSCGTEAGAAVGLHLPHFVSIVYDRRLERPIGAPPLRHDASTPVAPNAQREFRPAPPIQLPGDAALPPRRLRGQSVWSFVTFAFGVILAGAIAGVLLVFPLLPEGIQVWMQALQAWVVESVRR